MICRSSMPAGMVTFTVFRFLVCPEPPQLLQGVEMTFPLPPHLGQGPVVAKTPMGVWRRCCTVPEPPQPVQVSGLVPGAAPEPLQVSHCSTRSRDTSFSHPKAASSKEMVSPMRRLSPRCGPVRDRVPPPKPPPKKLPKMSPRSPKSKPPSNPPP